MLNESAVNVFIEVSEEQKAAADFNASQYGLTWQTLAFDESKMQL